VGLSDGPHGHEAAVASARDPEPRVIDRHRLGRGVDARQNIAQIAMAEIAHVGRGEAFALAEAAARIRMKHGIAVLEQRTG
jgi:hypothetical protein